MKRNIVLVALAALLMGAVSTVNAQEDNGRDARRQEFQARQTERLVKDLKLEGEKKTQFEAVYKRYQEELAATRQQTRQRDEDDTKKELTDEEATAKVNEIFTRQEEQIQQQQLRLDIQKKYCAEFSTILTPQQLVRVFQQPQGNRQSGRSGFQQGGRGGRGGFGGGPRGGGFGGGFGGGGDF